MKILLDTNAYAEWKRGSPEVTDLVRRAREIVFSAVVAGELLFGFRIVGVTVRMMFHRQTSIGFLEISLVDVFGDSQDFVVIAFGH